MTATPNQQPATSNQQPTTNNQPRNLETSKPTPFLAFDPAKLPPAVAYRLLVNAVAPRPIAFISSVSAEGVPNLAPFSFFMAGGANPPSVAFSPTNSRNNEPKDTLRNVRATGEFVVNVVSYGIREQMNHTSTAYPYGVSEWEPAGFTPVESVLVKPARVQESLISMECRVHDIITHGPGPLSANYVIGEVVYFHVAQSILINDQIDPTIDPTLVDYIGRLGGDYYTRAHGDSLFELPRP